MSIPAAGQGQDLRIVVPPAHVTVTTHAPTVTVSTPFWRYWLDIAVRQLEEATLARAQGIDMKANGGDLGTAMIAETQAAMIAAVASAACIESFYKTVASLTGYALPDRGKPAKHALEVLTRSFSINDAGLKQRLRDLFDDRNRAIHSGETHDPTAPHPLGVATGKDNAFFTWERASEAVALASGLLAECSTSVRPGAEFAQLARRLDGHRTAIQERVETARQLLPGRDAPGGTKGE